MACQAVPFWAQAPGAACCPPAKPHGHRPTTPPDLAGSRPAGRPAAHSAPGPLPLAPGVSRPDAQAGACHAAFALRRFARFERRPPQPADRPQRRPRRRRLYTPAAPWWSCLRDGQGQLNGAVDRSGAGMAPGQRLGCRPGWMGETPPASGRRTPLRRMAQPILLPPRLQVRPRNARGALDDTTSLPRRPGPAWCPHRRRVRVLIPMLALLGRTLWGTTDTALPPGRKAERPRPPKRRKAYLPRTTCSAAFPSDTPRQGEQPLGRGPARLLLPGNSGGSGPHGPRRGWCGRARRWRRASVRLITA